MSVFDVHLWLLDEQQVTPAQLAHACTHLSPQELARAERFRFERDRRLYLTARAHVRQVLSHYAPVSPAAWRFEKTSSGRPEIAPGLLDCPLHFSLSHTYGLIALAVSRTPDLGVDVERLDRTGDLHLMAKETLTRWENDFLASLTEMQYRERFLQLWTLKEAYAKARGLGLSLAFQRFGFSLEKGFPEVFGEDAEICADLAKSWQFASVRPTAFHQMAYAVRRSGGSTTTEWTTL